MYKTFMYYLVNIKPRLKDHKLKFQYPKTHVELKKSKWAIKLMESHGEEL